MTRVETFSTTGEHTAYVEAETKDPACISAYMAYASAPHRDRHKTGKMLDAVRHRFYKKWAKENK